MLRNCAKSLKSWPKCHATTPLARLHNSAGRCKTFEPDYLDAAGSVPPTYPPVNIQLKGYDFHILENYQGFIHETCHNIGLKVNDCWASPCKSHKINLFQIGGTAVKDSFDLNLYERNVQLTNLTSVDAPVLYDILRVSLPEGVQVSVHENTEAHYEQRFIPDPFVEGLKVELEEIENKNREDLVDKAMRKEEKDLKKKQSLLASVADDDDEDDY